MNGQRSKQSNRLDRDDIQSSYLCPDSNSYACLSSSLDDESDVESFQPPVTDTQSKRLIVDYSSSSDSSGIYMGQYDQESSPDDNTTCSILSNVNLSI